MISNPSATRAGIRQETIGSPLTSTVQLPHPPWPHPALTEYTCNFSRNTSRSESTGPTIAATGFPLSVKETVCMVIVESPPARAAHTLPPSSADTTQTRARRWRDSLLASPAPPHQRSTTYRACVPGERLPLVWPAEDARLPPRARSAHPRRSPGRPARAGPPLSPPPAC